MRKNQKIAFTLTELIVSITITIIILVPLLLFVSNISKEISDSNKEVEIITHLYEIENKIKEIKSIYSSWYLLIDNDKWTWADVFLFRTKSWEVNKGWYIFTMVNLNTLNIDSNNNVPNIDRKVFAYREISWTQLDIITTTPSKVYDYIFNLDETYKNIILKDFQVDIYNWWNILEFNLFIYPFYSTNTIKTKYSDVPGSEIKRFIINF